MIDFKIERNDSITKLVYELKENDRPDHLVLGMLLNNELKGIAAVNAIQQDGTKYFKYDVSGFESLGEMLKGVVKIESVKKVFMRIGEAILNAQEYMINPTSFVLESSCVYVNPQTGEVKMLCIPLLNVVNEINYCSFYKSVLMEAEEFDSTEELAKILSMLKPSTFELKSFVKELKEAFGEEPEKEENYIQILEAKMAECEKRIQEIACAAEETEENPVETDKEATVETEQIAEESSEDITAEQEEATKESAEEAAESEEAAKAEEVEVEIEVETQENDVEAATEPEAAAAVPEETEAEVEIGAGDGETVEVIIAEDEVIVDSTQPVQSPRHQEDVHKGVLDEETVEKEIGDADTVDAETADTDNTENDSLMKVTFTRISTEESVTFSKAKFLIGSDKERVDYLIEGNDKVDPVHVIIKIENEEVLVEDCESGNFTLLNGVALEPEWPVTVISGSKITIGNEDYMIQY